MYDTNAEKFRVPSELPNSSCPVGAVSASLPDYFFVFLAHEFHLRLQTLRAVAASIAGGDAGDAAAVSL